MRSFDCGRHVATFAQDFAWRLKRRQSGSRFDSHTLRHEEGTAEWPATGPENRGMVMSHGRSIRLPSAKFKQVAISR